MDIRTEAKEQSNSERMALIVNGVEVGEGWTYRCTVNGSILYQVSLSGLKEEHIGGVGSSFEDAVRVALTTGRARMERMTNRLSVLDSIINGESLAKYSVSDTLPELVRVRDMLVECAFSDDEIERIDAVIQAATEGKS